MNWIVEVWTAYAHRAASYQTRVLLTLVYLVVLGPAAGLGRLLGAHLLDLNGTSSTWIERSRPEKSLTALRRQF